MTAGREWFVDANLLVLLVVGKTDRSLIAKHKRLSMFASRLPRYRAVLAVGPGECGHALSTHLEEGDRGVAEFLGDQNAEHEDRVGLGDHHRSRGCAVAKQLQHDRAGGAGADRALHGKDATAQPLSVLGVARVGDRAGYRIHTAPEAEGLAEEQQQPLGVAGVYDRARQFHRLASRTTRPQAADATQSSRLP